MRTGDGVIQGRGNGLRWVRSRRFSGTMRRGDRDGYCVVKGECARHGTGKGRTGRFGWEDRDRISHRRGVGATLGRAESKKGRAV
eukprot:gene10247-biopygen15515